MDFQHVGFPCPSPTPGACSNSCPSNRWCHPIISSSAVPFSSCLQSCTASGSFPMSQLFASGGQSIEVSALASLLPVNIQDWFPLGWTGWISLLSKRIFFFFIFFIFKIYITVLVLPNIKMNPPQVYMCSPSWSLLPPPSPFHPSGSSQCTSPKHPVSCFEPGLATRLIHDILHVSMPFSQIFPPSPSLSESIRLFYTSMSLLLSRTQGYCYHLSKFDIYMR